jgi:hypothetical protein
MKRLDEILKLLTNINENVAKALTGMLKSSHKKEALDVDELMTRMTVVYKLGISERTYNRWVKAGILVPIELGNRHYYREEDLESAMKRSINKGLK